MTEKRYFGDIEVEESHARFETYDAIPNDSENKVHHDRVSVKFASDTQDEVESIAIQPFVDEGTPHGRMGTQLDPAAIDRVIDALELIRMDHLRE